MVVEKGYKQTEVGVIPEDWRIVEINDAIEFSGGSQPPRSTFVFSEKPDHIRLLQIRDYKSDRFLTFIPLALANKICKKDDIMIGRYGPPIFQILTGLDGAYNVALIKAIPKNIIDKQFAYYFLKQETLFNFVEKLSQRSSGQTGVDLFQLKLYKFPLPPLPEQTAIANALSDMDALIAQTEKLIEKKKAIKQGVMQELLKPKEGWVTKKLGEVGKCLRGVSYNPEIDLHKFPDSTNFSLLRSNNIFEGLLELNNLQFVNKMKVKDFQVVKDSDIIICMANGSKQLVGKSAIADNIEKNRYTYGAFMGCFRTFDSFNPKFVFSLMQSKIFRNYIDILLSGSSINNLNPSNIESISFAFPDLITQNEIAEIIDAYSKELESLNLKLQKLKHQKQGMMQALLTGKIRLI
jgi:type I restriction enzyme S subunit